MKFVCNFYIYVLIIIFTRGIWIVRCSTDFKIVELKYLSEKLDPTECLNLLDAVYQRTANKQETARLKKIHKAIQSDLGNSWVTRKNCLFHLENWHKDFPGRGNIKGREAMEDALRSLGRPDLAKHIRQNRRNHFLNRVIKSNDFFENNEHDLSRPFVSENEKEPVFYKKKYIKRNGQAIGIRHHKLKLDEDDNSKLHPAQVIMYEQKQNK